MYATKEEAQPAFKALLTESKVSTTWPWDKVKRKIMNEPRFNALRREGERKKCWNAWKPQRAKEEREEHRVAVHLGMARLERAEPAREGGVAAQREALRLHLGELAREVARQRPESAAALEDAPPSPPILAASRASVYW